MNYTKTIVGRLLHLPPRDNSPYKQNGLANGRDYRLRTIEEGHKIKYIIQSDDGRTISGDRKVEIVDGEETINTESRWMSGVPFYYLEDDPNILYPIRSHHIVRLR